jgi:transposase-like protein
MLLLASSVCGLFKWRQFEPEVILLAVGWYLRFSLSYRYVEELLAERGLHADHVTVWRWVQRYAPEMERRLRRHLKPTNDSWRVDETYIRVKGKWRCLYRAVDSSGAILDFLLSAKQGAAAAKRFLAKALGRQNHPVPRVINTDKHAAYPPAIATSCLRFNSCNTTEAAPLQVFPRRTVFHDDLLLADDFKHPLTDDYGPHRTPILGRPSSSHVAGAHPTALCHDPLTPEFGLRCIRAGRLAMSPSGMCVIETLRKKARLPRDALGDL